MPRVRVIKSNKKSSKKSKPKKVIRRSRPKKSSDRKHFTLEDLY